MSMEYFTLYNGVKIPSLGFGTFQITDNEICKNSVLTAIESGYRMMDTAACYGNENAVGEAVAESGIDRKDFTLVSKVWIQDSGYRKTMISFEKTLKNLQTDYIDLYLIHMPFGDYYGSWKAMNELLMEGRVKAIGVCNFSRSRLVDLILGTGIIPMVNQIEMHPFCQQKELRETMKEYSITPMAWAPFAEGRNSVFSDSRISAIAKRHGRTNAEVVLRFLIDEGAAVIPKSIHEERIRENAALDFSLDSTEMKEMRALDSGKPLILDTEDPEEAIRLHRITFNQ